VRNSASTISSSWLYDAPSMSAAFDDKSAPPDDAALSKLLGKSKKAWDATLAHVQASVEKVDVGWKFYGSKHGWQIKATRGKKAVLYMIPHAGKFVAATALPRQALEQLEAAGLPDALVAEIRAAKPYAEGTPARVEVTSAKQVTVIKRLLALKLG
jgi:hypothetical protein